MTNNNTEKVGLYEGKSFVITIDRNCMQRRYVLKVIDDVGNFVQVHEQPLFQNEFENRFGFEVTWPHYRCKNDK